MLQPHRMTHGLRSPSCSMACSQAWPLTCCLTFPLPLQGKVRRSKESLARATATTQVRDMDDQRRHNEAIVRNSSRKQENPVVHPVERRAPDHAIPAALDPNE